ncbi:MAG: ABC transporter ATP-binding protein [Spirochaetales bacterium]|nr:ABC transporter ATP-binding protein [Spirochaetales bacterium]
MEGILVEKLNFSYSGGFKLQIDRLEMGKGELTVILGPNGSGKSTLFSLLRGRLKSSHGLIHIMGRDVSRVNDRERASLVGLVPQLSELPYGFTVEEVVKMGAYWRGNRAFEEKLNEVLEQTDLSPLRRRGVASLSGGEYQRVLLARVLLQDPEVLLLDEPANHLDLRHQETLLNQLRGQADRGKTVVAILHDVNHALLYGDRVILMNEGLCVQAGRAKDVVTPENIGKVYHSQREFYYPSEGEGRPILGPGRR